MTQEIIDMARQAGIGWGEGIGGMTDFLEAFAKLVAEKEREACEKACEHQPHWTACCAAIRARRST